MNGNSWYLLHDLKVSSFFYFDLSENENNYFHQPLAAPLVLWIRQQSVHVLTIWASSGTVMARNGPESALMAMGACLNSLYGRQWLQRMWLFP